MEPQQVVGFFSNFLSVNNAFNNDLYKRTAEQYNHLKTQPQVFIQLHLIGITNAPTPELRALILNYLRSNGLFRSSSSRTPSVFQTLPAPFRTEFARIVINLINAETSKDVLKAYSFLTVAIYQNISELHEQWIDIWTALFQWFASADETHKLFAVTLMSRLLPIVSKEILPRLLPSLLQATNVALISPSPEMACNGIALFRSICSATNQLSQQQLLVFYPLVIDALNRIFRSEDMESKTLSLEIIQEFCEIAVDGFERYAVTLVQLMLSICQITSKTIDYECHQVAVEVISTTASTYKHVFKSNNTIQQLVFTQLIKWLNTITDTPYWFNAEDETDVLPYFYLAYDFIPRLLEPFGCQCLYQIISQSFVQFSQAQDWQSRHTLVLLLNILINTKKQILAKEIAQIVNVVFKFHKDPAPRVRFQTVIFFNRVFSNFKKLRDQFFPFNIDLHLGRLADGVPRIQERTCDFFSFFIDGTPAEKIAQYVPRFLDLLSALFGSRQSVVTEAICALSYLILKIKGDFQQYYSRFCPLLQNILTVTPVTSDAMDLKGRVIECFSIIGMSLGAAYIEEASTIIFTEIRRIMSAPSFAPEDTIFGYIETSFTRIAEKIPDKVSDFLPVVMPVILARAKIDITTSTTFSDSEVETKTVDGLQVCVHTVLSDEKKNAIGAISDLANDLRQYFACYAKPCLEAVLPSLEQRVEETLRSTTAKCVVHLLQALLIGQEVATSNPSQALLDVQPHFIQAVEALCRTLHNEVFAEQTAIELKALDNIISLMDLVNLAEQPFRLILGTLLDVFTKTYRIAVQKQTEKKRVVDALAQEDEAFAREVVENLHIILGRLFLVNRPSRFPLFTQLFLPFFTQIIHTPTAPSLYADLVFSLLTTILIESRDLTLLQAVTENLLARLQNPDAVVRAGVIRNLGRLAVFPELQPLLPKILSVLVPLPDRQQHAALFAQVVIALGNFMAYHPGVFDRNSVLEWLGLLPVHAKNAQDSIKAMALLFTRNILQVDEELLGKVFSAVTQTALRYPFLPETRELVVECLRVFQQRFPERFEALWGALTQKERTTVNVFLK